MPFQKKRNRSKIGRLTPKKAIHSPVKGERGKLTCREVDLCRIRRQFRINDFEKATGTVVQQRKRPKTKGYVKTTLAVKTQRRIDKWRNKCGDLTTLVKGLRLQFVHVLHALDETRAMYEHKVAGLEGDIAKLQHEPDEGSDDDGPTVDDEGFVTFKDPDGSIQFELSIVIMDLINLGVSQRTIWPALMNRRNLKLAEEVLAGDGGEEKEGAAVADGDERLAGMEDDEDDDESPAWGTDDDGMPCCDEKWVDGVDSVYCDTCKEWRHCSCERVAFADVRKRPRYDCSACVPVESTA
jgi:hypothetical protein